MEDMPSLKRTCRICGARMAQDHQEDVCSPCHESGEDKLDNSEKSVYNTKELAELLGCCEETVRRMARRGEIRGTKTGGYRFTKDEVDRLVGVPCPRLAVADENEGQSVQTSEPMESRTVRVTLDARETTLPAVPVIFYHELGVVPKNVLVAVTDKGVPGKPPLASQLTASSYVLASQATSGQVVLHKPIPPALANSSSPVAGCESFRS